MSGTASNHPAVTKIRIEYADGSHDKMELLDASQGLYSWDRKRPTGKNARGGLYTANRIAAQLLKTALEGQLEGGTVPRIDAFLDRTTVFPLT